MKRYVSNVVRHTLSLLIGLIGFMIGAPQLHAAAQGVATDTIGKFAQPSAPILPQHISWLTTSADYGMKDITINPTTVGVIVTLSVIAIIAANIRFRPRHAH